MVGQSHPIDYQAERARLMAQDAALAQEAEGRRIEHNGNRRDHAYQLRRIEYERSKIAGKLDYLAELEQRGASDE